MEHSTGRPPLRVNNRREVLTLDRDVRDIQDAYVYLAALPSKELKFGMISINTTERKLVKEECEQYRFEGQDDRVIEDSFPAMADLVYGFTFPVSVTHFRMWVEQAPQNAVDIPRPKLDQLASSQTAKKIDLVDFRRSNKAVREVRFEPPIVSSPMLKFFISYTPNPREFYSQRVCLEYGQKSSQYPHLTSTRFIVSVLTDDARGELQDGLTTKTFEKLDVQPVVDKDAPIEDRPPQYSKHETWKAMSIKPIVILRDGSTYDKNIVEVDPVKMEIVL